ncbi:protein of unknown function [Serratia sp. Tan611]|nr:protein of unknown function [Serratia sp. Tan611]
MLIIKASTTPSKFSVGRSMLHAAPAFIGTMSVVPGPVRSPTPVCKMQGILSVRLLCRLL